MALQAPICGNKPHTRSRVLLFEFCTLSLSTHTCSIRSQDDLGSGQQRLSGQPVLEVSKPSIPHQPIHLHDCRLALMSTFSLTHFPPLPLLSGYRHSHRGCRKEGCSIGGWRRGASVQIRSAYPHVVVPVHALWPFHIHVATV